MAKFGRIVNARYVDGDGIRGDLRYNPKHQAADTFVGWLEHDPSGVGFSHCAFGKVRPEKGVDIVYEIEEVESVDLVASPATTKGIFEVANPVIPDPDAVQDQVPVKPTLDVAVAELLAVIMGDMTLTPQEKRDKILTALDLTSLAAPSDPVPGDGKAGDEQKEKPEPEEKSEEKPEPEEKKKPESDEKAKESVKALKLPSADRVLELLAAAEKELKDMKEEKSKREAREHAEKMCRDAGLEKVSEVFLGVLTDAKSDEIRSALIKDRKSAFVEAKTPVSVTPASGDVKLTVDELVKTLNEVK
jgi:hypothetical protein